MTEAEFQKQVIDTAMWMGWKVMHISDSRKMVRRGGSYKAVADPLTSGWPDLFLVKGSEVRVFELKSAKGRLTDSQKDWLETLSAAGLPCFVLRPHHLLTLPEYLNSGPVPTDGRV